MGPVSLVMRAVGCLLAFVSAGFGVRFGFRGWAEVGGGRLCVSRGLDLLLFGRRHPRRYLLLSRPSRSLLRGTSGVQPRDSEQ